MSIDSIPFKMEQDMILFGRVNKVDDELVEAFRRLIPMLSAENIPPGRELLEEMVNSQATNLFTARSEQDQIVGLLALVIYRVPTGKHGYIEDVVVDEAWRGQGIGEGITREALDYARQEGARWVDLTSNPSRAAANRLYQRMGFLRRETNVYRYGLEGK